MSAALWERVLRVSLSGAFFCAFFCAQAAAQQMTQAGRGGRIINVASIDALRPTGALASYDIATLFLASDAAPYFTGSLLVVDGGYLLS